MSDIFSGLRIDHPLFVRVDGVNFSRVCDGLVFERPYDERISRALVHASELVFERFDPKLAYLFSDEINFFFTPPLPYDGRLEKLDSIVPSLVAGCISLEFGAPVAFDSKVIIPEDPADYLVGRQGEAWRNHLNSYAFYALLEEGFNRKEAARKLKGMKGGEIHEFMFKRGINLAETPPWQRRGVMLYKEAYMKEGRDPRKGKKVLAERKRVVSNWEIPIFGAPEGRTFLEGFVHRP